MEEMISYRGVGNDIIRQIEIDLTQVTNNISKRDLEGSVTKFLEYKGKKIFAFEGDKLVYQTEVLIPKTKKERPNLLLVVGNPAVHSVAEGMFFSYERIKGGKYREHRFWRALRECEIPRFHKNVEEPSLENNEYKREHLLNGEYKSDFNIFILPYFSFPTPASGSYSGVNGIREIVGAEIFEGMKKFEFQRFRYVIHAKDIRDVICFQKGNARKEILAHTKQKSIKTVTVENSSYEVYVINDALGGVTLYTAPPTRSFHIERNRKILKSIIADIKAKSKIGG